MDIFFASHNVGLPDYTPPFKQLASSLRLALGNPGMHEGRGSWCELPGYAHKLQSLDRGSWLPVLLDLSLPDELLYWAL
jgi:hypothetical protein